MKSDLTSSTEFIEYGSKIIHFKLSFTDRKTMEISVHPNTLVVVKAPFGYTLTQIKERIIKRSRWIIKQQNYFRQFTPQTPPRSYINGETHLYLGKQYRLNLTEGKAEKVKLKNGYFRVEFSDDHSPSKIKKIMDRWYIEKARYHFSESLIRCYPAFKNFGIEEPEISIRRMKRRWGSSTSNKTISINPELIKAPKECIDYVLTHELCHLVYNNHNTDFYRLLNKTLPEWIKIKHKLEIIMS